MRKLVSIVVPIYNVASYLSQCLDSIYTQTYPNIEVILVNDGSTDNSLDICKEYAKKFGCTIIDKENGGLSSARNTGLQRCNGEYVYFLDSDDWISKDAIEVLVNLIEERDVDIVEMGIYWVYPEVTKVDASKKDYLFNRYEVLSAYLQQTKKLHSCVTNKIFKSHVFDELRFEEGKLHEDGYFMYQAMYKCERYFLTTYAGYYYRQNREGSIMSVAVKPRNLLDVTDLMEKRNEFFRDKKEDELAEMAEAYYYRTTLTNYITARTIIKDQELAIFFSDRLYAKKELIQKNRYLKIKRIKFFLFFNFNNIFERIYKIRS